MVQKNPLLILTGPTAVGKTETSIRLAKQIGGEIISADSMQVYRGMDIGTAKISPDEMDHIPHHLIDVLEPEETFDVVRFQKMAKEAIFETLDKGRIPILTGGTGFYIQAVRYDIDFSEEEDDHSYRAELEQLAGRIGREAMHEKLKEVDPDAARAIPPGNLKRVIRALEYYEKNKRPISEHNARQKQRESIWNDAYFVITSPRDLIYRRIDDRVTQMLEAGLVDEVKRLKDRGCTKDMVSMQAIGYRQVLDYLDGLFDYEEMADRIRKETRHFAKRQLTWFRREKDVIWLDRSFYPGTEAMVEQIITVMNERGMLETSHSS